MCVIALQKPTWCVPCVMSLLAVIQLTCMAVVCWGRCVCWPSLLRLVNGLSQSPSQLSRPSVWAGCTSIMSARDCSYMWDWDKLACLFLTPYMYIILKFTHVPNMKLQHLSAKPYTWTCLQATKGLVDPFVLLFVLLFTLRFWAFRTFFSFWVPILMLHLCPSSIYLILLCRFPLLQITKVKPL